MERPLRHTLLARLLHWAWVLSLLLLILSGFYIHDPDGVTAFLFNGIGAMTTARLIHFICMYLVIALLVFRLYYSVVSGDIKEIGFRPKDVGGLVPLLAYYLFFTKTHPDFGLYNPGQRLLYSLFVPAGIIQACTGFALYGFGWFDWVTAISGGLVYVRVIHYLLNWFFLIAGIGHMYLSLINGLGTVWSMVSGRE